MTNKIVKVSETAQWYRCWLAKPGYLSFVPMWKERPDSPELFLPTHVHPGLQAHMHTLCN